MTAERRPHPLRIVLDHVRPYRRKYSGGLALLLATNALGASIPWLIKEIIDRIERGESVGSVAAVMLGVAVVMAVVRTGSRLCILGASRLVAADIRETVYAHLQRLSRGFYDRSKLGDLLSRVTSDVQLMRGLTGFGSMNLMNTAAALVFSIGMMLRIDPGLTVSAFLPYLLLIGVVRQVTRRVHQRTFAAQKALADMTALTSERITGFSVVRTFGAEEETVERFRESNGDYLRANLALVRARGAMVPLFSLMGGMGTLIVLQLGGTRVAEGTLGLGDFVAATGYLAMAAWPTMAVGWILNLIQRGRAAATRLDEILRIDPDSAGEENAGGSVLGGVAVAGAALLSVRGLGFAYEGAERDEPALAEISFDLPAGSILGITGPVGSGKSTLVALLTRQYSVPRGAVFLEGADINDLPLAELRRRVATVPQQGFLFQRSIRENIGFGLDAPIDDESLLRAADLAGFADIARELPRGYGTPAGERGAALSGGQRQRVALARALACASEILILDDPFSAVDAQTEDEVLKRLGSFLAGRTALIVSHRSASLRVADRILVLDRGRIAEEGSHESLLSAGGVYSRLHARSELERALEDAS